MLYSWKARRAIGLLLVCAYIINPYGLLLADGSADNTPDTGVPAVVQQDEDGQAPADVPETPAEDPDAALPQDATGTEDPSDTVSGDDKDITEVPADTEDPKVTEAPSDTEDPTDPSDINDADDPADTTDPTDATDATDTTDATDAAEPSETPVPTPSEVIPTPTPLDNDDKSSVIEDVVLDSAGKSWKVTATFGAECNIPEGAVLKVRELTSGKTYSEYKDMTEEYLDDRKVDYVRLFDISIVFDGKEIEPAEGTSVNVKIRLNDTPAGDLCVLHFPDDDRTQLYEDVAVKSGKTTEVTFDTTGFSVFAVAGYTMEKIFEAGDGSTYKIVLTYDDNAGFPEGSDLAVRELKGSEYKDYLKRALEAKGAETASYAKIFDVSVVSSEGSEIQPKVPVKVDVALLDAAKDAKDYDVIHFGDSPEDVEYTAEGNILTFYAEGFSVYAIVTRNMDTPSDSGWKKIPSLDQIDSHLGEPIYISHTNGFFATGEPYTVSGSRTGIKKTTTKTPNDVEGAIGYGAVPYYIEKDEENDCYYIYTKDSYDVRQYVQRKGSGIEDNNDNKSLRFVTSREDATGFVFGVNGTGFYIADKRTVDTGTIFCWNQQGNDGGKGFAAYWGESVANAAFNLFYYKNVPDDPYDLNGYEKGLMSLNSGSTGHALMADAGTNYHALMEIVMRDNNSSRTLYVDEDNEITIWKFNNTSSDKYKISANVNGTTQYIKLDENGVSLTTSEADASEIRVVPGSGSNEGKISLSSGDYYLGFDPSVGYFTSPVASDRVWLNFVEETSVSPDESLVYSARKVSISDETNVTNGTKLIIYFRRWNDQTDSYEFYAIDHNGSFHRVYECGDNIMWIENVLDSIQWEFTEYYWEGTTDPNYYYELYNPYSDKYIAPQINGQVLSENKIGINLEGRRIGEYYTEISAWDEHYYNYAALSTGATSLESGPVSKADTFYFAILNPVESKEQLHEVETVDNNLHGITMKMINIGGTSGSAGSNATTQYIGTSDTAHRQGILSTNIDENTGYPVIVSNGVVNPNFGGIFAGSYDVNHLFIQSVYDQSGYFEYNSCQNFATLLDDNGDPGTDFRVYKELGTIDGTKRETRKHGQFFPYNRIEPGVYAVDNPENLYDVMGASLPDSDPRKYEKLHLIQNPDNYLGMDISAKFVQTSSGLDAWGHDLIFEFTGDDDFWFYVDNELVLDLGGIHSAEAGTVNFRTGVVTYKLQVRDTTQYITHTDSLRDIFIRNVKARNIASGMSDADAEAAAIAAADTKFITTDGGATYHFNDYTTHEMRIFFMERGAGASNLQLRFNLSAVTPGSAMLTKTVTGEDADDLDFDLIKYPYQIYYKYSEDSSVYYRLDGASKVRYRNTVKKVDYKPTFTPPNGSTVYEDVYFLSPEMTSEIILPPGVTHYKIVECGLNTEIYETCKVNGVDAAHNDPEPGVRNFDSGWIDINQQPSVGFENALRPGSVRTLKITKKLYDENGEGDENLLTKEQDDTRFSFRLSLSNGSSSDVDLTNRYNYYVVDPAGYLCRWDHTAMDFAATSYEATEDVIDALTDEQKEEITFTTSSYGAISQIPAGYSVYVPGVPVGAVFMVEERPGEIPVGYKFLRYDGNHETYYSVAGSDNSGVVRAGYSPELDVKNMRGWGLTVNKVWSDKDYVTSYDPIYIALYENGSLIDGTVRQIRYPETSSYYFFDSSFDDIEVREVTLSNSDPSIDPDDKVTVLDPGTVTPVDAGDTVSVNIVPDPGHPVDYTVEYKQGMPHGANDNIREDTITNVKDGAVVLTLYDWNSEEPLEGGEFTLTLDGTPVGTYTSDSAGRIAILYDLERNRDYVLTQTKAPTGYTGIGSPVTFNVDDLDKITITHTNGDGWADTKDGVNGIIGYINIHNKPLTLKIFKHDSDVVLYALKDAHFALHRQLHNSIAGYSKSPDPMEGYEDLVTDSKGIIVLSSPSTAKKLKAGSYYLTETQAPDGFQGITEDIIITISDNGKVSINDVAGVVLTEKDLGSELEYTVKVPNEGDVPGTLVITKEVKGNFGNKAKDFDVTVILTDDSYVALANIEVKVSKNDETPRTVTTDAEGKLYLTIAHDDTVTITEIPAMSRFTVEEDPEGYTAEAFLDDVSLGETSSVPGQVPLDVHVHFENTFNGIIPTGVSYVSGAAAVLASLAVAGFAVFIAVTRRRRQDLI